MHVSMDEPASIVPETDLIQERMRYFCNVTADTSLLISREWWCSVSTAEKGSV